MAPRTIREFGQGNLSVDAPRGERATSTTSGPTDRDEHLIARATDEPIHFEEFEFSGR